MNITPEFPAIGTLMEKQKRTSLLGAASLVGLMVLPDAMNAATGTAAMIGHIMIERIAHFV